MTLSNGKQKMYFFLIFSVIVALILSFTLRSSSIEEQLINLSVTQNLSYLDESIKNESIETKVILLDYASNKELAFKSWLALKKYPKKSENIFFLYGERKEFQAALLNYGEHIIPVIDYFLKNESFFWNIQKAVTDSWRKLESWWNNKPKPKSITKLSAEMRGWYAINYINQEGHHFLSQFSLDPHGDAKWIQTTRTLLAFGEFLTSGIRTLETKYKTEQAITAGDIFWASFDVITVTSGLKLLKSSKALSSAKTIRSSKKIGLITKTKIFAFKFLKNKTAQKIFAYGAITTTLYVAITHPSFVNTLFYEIATRLNLSPSMVKILSWTALIFLLLYPLSWIFRIFMKPTLWLLNTFLLAGIRLDKFLSNTASELKK